MNCLVVLALVVVPVLTSEVSVTVLEQNLLVTEKVRFQEDYTSLSMPQHNNLQAVTIITHHPSGYTARMLPNHDACFVMKDDPAALPTEKQWGPTSTQEEEVWSNIANISTIYRHQGLFKDVSSLPHPIRKLCHARPVHQVALDTHQEEIRDRVFFTADPGMFVEIDLCPAHMQAQACKMFGDDKTCHYVQICDSTSGASGKDEAVCDRVHKWGEVRCCIPCCLANFPPGTENVSPYCMDPKIDELINCQGYGF